MSTTATKKSSQVNASILGKEYCLACEEHEQADLERAVGLLNERIREFRAQGRVVGAERVAVLAAVHLAYDILLEQQQRQQMDSEIGDGIRRISTRIEDALATVAEPGPVSD